VASFPKAAIYAIIKSLFHEINTYLIGLLLKNEEMEIFKVSGVPKFRNIVTSSPL
jgi:hypothetical protein